MKAPEYFLGVDLGQKTDPTAIAILERSVVSAGFDRVNWCPIDQERFHLRHLEVIKLGTTYSAVVARLGELVGPLSRNARVTIVADATGVGAPIIEFIRDTRLPATLVPVTITCGERESSDGFNWHVPKRDLLESLQLMFEQGELKIAASLPENREFLEQLSSMQVRVTNSQRETFSPVRTTAHDDLVLAASLAAWRAKQKPRSIWVNFPIF